MASEQQVGNIVYQVEMNVARLIEAQRQVNDRLDRMEGGFNSTGRAAQNAERSFASLSRVAGALIAALSVQQVASYADAWTTVNNKLSNAIRPSEQLAQVTQRVFDITQSTRSSLDATASLYARLERATRQAGASTANLARLTTIINQGFVVSGATAQEAENAIIQLSQGLASGTLRGEEFNSVNEQGNRLMVALADSMGVGIGELRNMAAQGKLTTDVVVNGLLSQGDAIGKEFAKTTTTISQAMQVAGNNITKFFGENATVKSGVSAFNSAIISVSENIGALSGALVAVAAVMGSRYVAALTLATAEKIKGIAASRNQASAESIAARAAANKATSDLRAATVAKDRALEEIRLAQMMKASAYNAANAAAAEQRLSAARVVASGAVDNYNRSLAANNAAQSALSSGSSLVSRALGLVGGPVGAAVLAASAVFYFSQRAQEARDSANSLADNINELTEKFKTMSSTEVAASIAKLRQNIPQLSDAVDEAQKSFDKATERVAGLRREVERYGTNTTRGRQASAALSGALDEQAIASDNLERANKRLSQTNSAVYMGQAKLTGGMRQGLDLLKRNGEEAGVVAGMMSQLGNAINFAARAKDKFNSSSLKIERPKEIQEYLDGQQQQIELQSELNERKRAQLKAEQDIRNLAGKEKLDDKGRDQLERDVATARERAGVEFDAIKAQQDKKKAESEANAEGKKSASQAESIALKLENMKQQTQLATSATENLSREQAILRAQQSLGKGATEENTRLAGEYAAAQWDASRAARAASLVPVLAENQSYRADLQALQASLKLKEIDQDQYYRSVEQRELQHQSNLAKIRAEQSVANPIADMRGQVDPVQQLVNQNNQKLAAMQAYQAQEQELLAQSYANGKLSYDQFTAAKAQTDAQYLALRTAQEKQANEQMTDAQWELLSQQGLGYDMLTSAVDAFAGNASNAITGLLTGTMSVSDAMRSLGNTILNSVINSIVQMGVEWVKNLIIQKTMGAAATALGVTQAGVLATAWAPAAAMASLATLGANAAAATAGISSTVGVASGLALTGMRKNGGPVSAGGLYQVGEGGMPEIYQASNGKQYMIPGDNGSVISNKDMQGGGAIPSVIINITNTNGSHVETSQPTYKDGALTMDMIVADVQQGGRLGQTIATYHNAPRRALG